MKIDNTMLTVLKNYSAINPSILFREGNVLRTISPNKSICSAVKLNQTIEKPFAIFDLSKFLSAISLFDKPLIKFGDENFATITSDNDSRYINYVFTDPTNIKGIAPESNPKIGNVITSFDLRKQSLIDASKALGIFSLPMLGFIADGQTLTLQALDPDKKSGSHYSEVIGETDLTFKAYMNTENIKVLPNDYHVEVSKTAIHLYNDDIDYWIAVANKSEF